MHPRTAILFALATVTAVAVASCAGSSEQTPPDRTAPDTFAVRFETTRGPFTVEVVRAWAPLGADRFHTLVQDGFFDDGRFFRVIPGFIAQFGANGDPERNERWSDRRIDDDPVVGSNVRGTLAFAHNGPGSRAHQLFFNLNDNPALDADGFAPIGRVVDGMSVVDSIHGGYGEKPDYHLIATLGNAYLERAFPKMDVIRSARVIP